MKGHDLMRSISERSLPRGGAEARIRDGQARVLVGGDRTVLNSRFGWRSAAFPALLSAVVLLLSTRGIMSEGTVSLQGDMPRYLMNGAYFYDLLHDLPLRDPVGYTIRYFARYPALSLGHHPLLLGVAEAPFYAAFGISIFSARLLITCFALLGSLALYGLARLLYDEVTALFAALLLATTPFVAEFTRVVMSEISALSLILLAAFFLVRYCETSRRRDAVGFALAAAMSLYGKHHAALMLPVFFAYFAVRCGVRALLRRDVLIAAVLIGVLAAPLVPITLELSTFNLAFVAAGGGPPSFETTHIPYYIEALWTHLVTAPVLVLAVLGLFASIYRRDSRVLLGVLWIVGFYVEITYAGGREPRYAVYWIPGFCLLAAALFAQGSARGYRLTVGGILLAVVGYQLVLALEAEPTIADGYEAAARYVLQHPEGESVLFAGNVDSGFFPFFVRKHDPSRRLIVLRADKVIVTSKLGGIVNEQLTTREQINQALRAFGTGYVVIEDAPFDSPPLELLRQELKDSGDFELRKRIPIRTNNAKLRGVDLAIYEYKKRTPANPDAVLKMRIPLLLRDLALPMRELLRQ
jgi:hypothetical protein